ncbi:MAG: Gfo/Idh/MocA family oxidoreductase [Armatimonadota bacterium]|nr:Gfo/Idh/MocA family oxidoreductase [Armatimonadota bacterium]MCX7778495.1 Gfo/Idh/MocA family oxidoreductase [Armatimonadota bacterium]MDW8025621.1 Gfo/Idh/MocA family oxidoreductase [Armatimonadota bacterium]
MQKCTRRHFIKTSVGAIGGIYFINSNVFGANDRIRVAVAGLNGRGGQHIDEFMRIPGVEVAYLVDPDTRTFARRLKQIEQKGAKLPECVQDIRKVLDDKDVDVIAIATPNHWHSLMTIWACQAGKDVYVEKPCSHNVFEGRKAVEAARKYNRIVQHGTQSRSDARWRRTIEVIRSGQLGRLRVARGLCYKPRGSIGFKPFESPPKEVDFNIWLGPAPEQPYHGNLVHYNWHWFWDFGNGDIGNQGVHQMDIARWGLNKTLPISVISLGGRFGYVDQGQTPNTQIALFDFGDALLIFEVRGLKTEDYYRQRIGNIFHMDDVIVAGQSIYRKDGDKPEPLITERLEGRPNIFRNFIEAVRSRDQKVLDADILEGHYSSALCHLANISYRLGVDVECTGNGDKPFGDCDDANEAFGRMLEHLKENGVPIKGLKYRLGRKLLFDPKEEKFLNDEEANKLLTRQYRHPFVVPERV